MRIRSNTQNTRIIYIYIYILLFKGLPQFGKSFFFPQNTHISLGLNRDKIKR